MLNDVAVEYPCLMTEEDIQFFSYGTQPRQYQLSGSDAKKKTDFDEAKLRKLMESMWKLL